MGRRNANDLLVFDETKVLENKELDRNSKL